jgi:MFS family permease
VIAHLAHLSPRTSRPSRYIVSGAAQEQAHLPTGLFLPLAVVYATRVVELPLGLAGTVVAVGTAAGLAVPPFAGRLVDRLGPRVVVMSAQLLQAVGAAAYLVADGAGLTLVGAILLATGQQGFYSALFALVADVSSAGPKDRSFAQVNMVRSAAFGTGALAAGALLSGVDGLGLQIAVGLNAISFLASAGLLLAYVRDHHRPAAGSEKNQDRSASVLRDPPYLTLIVVTGLAALVTDFFLVGAPVFALEQLHTPEWLPGAVLALVTAIDSTCGTAAVKLTSHLSRTTAMRAGAILSLAWCLASMAAVVVPAAWQPAWLGASVLLACGKLMFTPRANALSEAAAPRASRGRYLAAFQYSFTVPGVVAPAVVALFELSIWWPWLVVASTTALGWLGLRWVTPRLPSHATLATGSSSSRG